MHTTTRSLSTLVLATLGLVATAAQAAPDAAKALAHDAIIVDGHIDAPMMLHREWTNLDAPGDRNFDGPSAAAGGLDAPFMSIYIPSSYQSSGGAKQLADELIDAVERMVAEAPARFALAKSPAEVRRNAAAGKISLPMGMENGAGIEDDLANLDHFYQRGIRYITLTHFAPNLIGDASSSPDRPHHGLTDYGRAVVQRMNALGIMVDVSHISDETFRDVIAVSKAPVIASHSSARHFTPGWERNMSDEMIETLGEHGGVIMINFGSGFLTAPANAAYLAQNAAIGAYMKDNGIAGHDDPKVKAFIETYKAANPYPYASVDDVVAHIDWCVKLAGIDHVGLGSDYDGLGDTLPTGLKTAADYPNLVAALQAKGYSDADLRKILGENLLRVWSEVEAAAGS